MTGAGTATNGAPVTINCTVAGTVTVTITGSLQACQLEAGSYPSSFMASGSRAADIVATSGALSTALAALPFTIFLQTIQTKNTGATLLNNSKSTFLSGGAGTRIVSASANSTNLTINVGNGNYTLGCVKSILASDSGGRSGVANNGTVATDANPMAVGALTLGVTQNGYTTRLAVATSRIADAPIKQLSA
jgi:hypothetical protein